MGRKSLGLFDIISIIFVILTVGWLLFVIVRLVGPAPVETETVVVPTVYLAPTFTPSRTPSATLPPTFTPTPTLTEIPSTTPTPSPTITNTPTITDTAVVSPTPSVTDTLVASPSFTPTGPTQPPSATPSPYLYDLRGGTYQLVPNTFNAAGCAWQGIGGQVFDLNGSELTIQSGLQVHVFSPLIGDRRTQVGSNSIYGISGWEVAVDTTVNANTYFVQLETQLGTQVSPTVQVTFTANCQQNAALLRFTQIRQP